LSYLFFVCVHRRREEGLYGNTPCSSTPIAVFFKQDLKKATALDAQGFQDDVNFASKKFESFET
jgi:hypothetical protein